MKILIIGNGAREHTLAWKVAQSPLVSQVFVAPGNAGTASLATNLDISSSKKEDLAAEAVKLGIDLTIVGPEQPLADGIVDLFLKKGIPIVGPSASATRIESSKAFAKQLMEKYDIPCARGGIFNDYDDALAYLDNQQYPAVIKADGLAAGKGVIIAQTAQSAKSALHDIMKTKVFGSAGERVVIEECLTGKEVSLLAFTDGTTVVPMIPACDYKRAYDNDKGLNTGGMGSYSPPSFFGADLTSKVTSSIIEPLIKGLANEGSPYQGVIYAGLMLTPDGPKVLEFNARFGDPETQVILPRLESDIVDIFLSIRENKLSTTNIKWKDDACVGVVMASGGYPGSYNTGIPIKGLDTIDKGIHVFHAGTRFNEDSRVVTGGGRVLTVVACGRSIKDARASVYDTISGIQFDGGFYRNDIALREVD